MAMTSEGFLKRMRAGKAVNCKYRHGDIIGLLAAWFHAGKYVLTWEECLDVDFYNESAYLRDETHHFKTPEEVLDFVEQNGYLPSAFQP